MKPFETSAAQLPEGMRVKAPTRDIAGQVFGRLTVVRVVGKSKSNSLLWECVCSCGATISRSSAKKRKAKGVCSCGCYLRDHSKERLRQSSPWNKGATYQTKPNESVFSQRGAWAKAVLRANGNSCVKCGWDKARCDVHHITPRSRGGLNTIANGVVLCPNCHRIEHEVAL